MTAASPSLSGAPALRLIGVTKRFGSLVANDDMSLSLGHGEILALLGENGAGKTTLMNVVFGHYTADAGQVFAFGRELPPGRPRAAIEAGIGMVHQHFTLASNLSVLDNVIAGTERLARFRSDREGARRRLADISQRFDLPVEPDAFIGDLSVGERQKVEILKALYRGAQVLILDEPTAVLTVQEALTLFATLRAMATRGLSLIFISHKLHEVMGAADRVVVLRGGRVVAERQTRATTREELAELMIGRRVARPIRERRPPGELLLRARNLYAGPPEKGLRGLDFEVRAGETLGVIGVSGNGQTLLGELASGLLRAISGEFELFGQAVTRPSARRFVMKGVGRIPEDRHASGAIGDMTLWENVVLERLRTPAFSTAGFVRRAAARAFTQRVIERFDVRGGKTRLARSPAFRRQHAEVDTGAKPRPESSTAGRRSADPRAGRGRGGGRAWRDPRRAGERGWGASHLRGPRRDHRPCRPRASDRQGTPVAPDYH